MPMFNKRVIVSLLVLFLVFFVFSCRIAPGQNSVSTSTTTTPTSSPPIITAHVVKVFISPTWGWCTKVEEFLDRNGVKYEKIDVTQNPDAFREVLNITHQNVVPQTYIDGTVVVGYDEAQLKAKLGITD